MFSGRSIPNFTVLSFDGESRVHFFSRNANGTEVFRNPSLTGGVLFAFFLCSKLFTATKAVALRSTAAVAGSNNPQCLSYTHAHTQLLYDVFVDVLS